jgi:uncharacterized protein (DUF3084 family)
MDRIKEQIEREIENIANEGVGISNIDYLGKLVDIHKDLTKMEYLEEKKTKCEEVIEEIQEKYQSYYRNKNNGSDTMRSLDCMLRCAYDFMRMLRSEATTQAEVELIREYSRKISTI